LIESSEVAKFLPETNEGSHSDEEENRKRFQEAHTTRFFHSFPQHFTSKELAFSTNWWQFWQIAYGAPFVVTRIEGFDEFFNEGTASSTEIRNYSRAHHTHSPFFINYFEHSTLLITSGINHLSFSSATLSSLFVAQNKRRKTIDSRLDGERFSAQRFPGPKRFPDEKRLKLAAVQHGM
jgi:hypothetical protein